MKRVTTLAAVALLCACSGSLIPDEAPYAGTIVARFESPPAIHVKTATDQQCGTVFSIDSHTDIVQKLSNGTETKKGFDSLVVGAKVNVWTSNGAILTSCPGQGKATTVQIL